MERDTISPYASFLEYSEEMYLLLGNIKILITYGFGFVILILLFMIDGFFKLNIFIKYFWHLGIFAGFFALIILYASIPVYKDVSKWEKNYINSSFFMTFSVLPIKGEYREDILLVKILKVFIRYHDILSDYSDDMLLANFTNVTLEGNTKEHNFDVFIAGLKDDDYDKETRKMMEALKNKGYIVAKIFDKKEPVNSLDLDEYRSDLLDVTTHRGVKKLFLDDHNPFRIIVVSNSSFTDDAVEYVKNRENSIKKVSFDLIEQKDDISNIIWIS